jgi:hypothetical protein
MLEINNQIDRQGIKQQKQQPKGPKGKGGGRISKCHSREGNAPAEFSTIMPNLSESNPFPGDNESRKL